MNKGTCIHYTGLRNKESCCAAGINYYDKFSGEETGVILRMPCVQYHVLPAHGRGTYIKPGDATIRKEIDRHGRVMLACDRYLEPTDAEIEQDRIDSEACLRRAMAGIEIAAAWRVRPKQKKIEAKSSNARYARANCILLSPHITAMFQGNAKQNIAYLGSNESCLSTSTTWQLNSPRPNGQIARNTSCVT